MNLKKYLSNRPRGFKSEFAKKLGISKSFLRQVETGYSKAPIYLAKKIEKLTNKEIKKSDIRPDVWG
ncbi:transcriptional regulator [Mergibacter septicus]|uniref:Transcriptional regulator n=1 Tax=Mergibacter septicus TaxID=221402 RepID=A0A8E3MF53_9PAST|nr:helix-turn-helix domain-containing protein [Mergibacter septicus]AWX14816.1 transcriptional regulator [Mergibacter septicus]QDJ14068.1 transcriptional regulator [Mergibacter septicus]UTU48484.1 helix-turn-helix domain-containing protein [Mergibacter septicus]WMR95887.1 YdaS family helix-turn-helix protein [Mergibacter septicus]